MKPMTPITFGECELNLWDILGLRSFFGEGCLSSFTTFLSSPFLWIIRILQLWGCWSWHKHLWNSQPRWRRAQSLQFHLVCLRFEHQPKKNGAELYSGKASFLALVRLFGFCPGWSGPGFRERILWHTQSFATFAHWGPLGRFGLLLCCKAPRQLQCQSHPTRAQKDPDHAARQPSLWEHSEELCRTACFSQNAFGIFQCLQLLNLQKLHGFIHEVLWVLSNLSQNSNLSQKQDRCERIQLTTSTSHSVSVHNSSKADHGWKIVSKICNGHLDLLSRFVKWKYKHDVIFYLRTTSLAYICFAKFYLVHEKRWKSDVINFHRQIKAAALKMRRARPRKIGASKPGLLSSAKAWYTDTAREVVHRIFLAYKRNDLPFAQDVDNEHAWIGLSFACTVGTHFSVKRFDQAD